MKVTTENFKNAIMDILISYSEDVENELKKEITKTARTIRNMLLNHPRIPVRTGMYKKGFRVKKAAEGSGYLRLRIYNKEGWRTHLLENGHDIIVHGVKKDGKTSAYPHWKDAQEIADTMVERVKERLDELR